MATLDDLRSNEPRPALAEPLLHDGQRLDQATFHYLYTRMPEDCRAELIEGVVYIMSSPVNPKHGRPHIGLSWFLYEFPMETPGTIAQGDTTAKLGPRNEVQPDCALPIDPVCGGQTGADVHGYTTGCPELVVEIGFSTLSIALNAKKKVYQEAGALEYIVYDEPHSMIHWVCLARRTLRASNPRR